MMWSRMAGRLQRREKGQRSDGRRQAHCCRHSQLLLLSAAGIAVTCATLLQKKKKRSGSAAGEGDASNNAQADAPNKKENDRRYVHRVCLALHDAYGLTMSVPFLTASTATTGRLQLQTACLPPWLQASRMLPLSTACNQGHCSALHPYAAWRVCLFGDAQATQYCSALHSYAAWRVCLFGDAQATQ